MNECLKSFTLSNFSLYIDNFNDGMITFFDNLDLKYDEFIVECKKFKSEYFDFDNIKKSNNSSNTKNKNVFSRNNLGYNLINTHNNKRKNSPTELKEIVCISNNKISEHIFVKTEQLAPNISKIKKIDNPRKFKKSKSFNDKYTFIPNIKNSIDTKLNRKSKDKIVNKSINNISSSSSESEHLSDDSWDLLNNE